MPVELQIIRAAEFVRIGGQGKFDLAASCAILANLAQACKRRGIHRALLDARNATAELNPTELASLVNVFREIGFTRNQRLAILHSGDPYHRARLFAFISRMKGWSVRAFGDFEEALRWLSDEQEKPRPKTSASAKRLHINHADGEAKPISIKSPASRKGERRRGVLIKAQTVAPPGKN
jgi:hypothetical protein